MYRAQVKEGFSDDAAAYVCSSLLEASSDSTAATLYGFIQAMVVWPEVQRKAQEEIDRVVGPDRLPNLEDYESMPYIRCCIKENLRWMPTVILGVPHAPLRDDTYMGYTIPKGATVINNVWWAHPELFLQIQTSPIWKYRLIIIGLSTWTLSDLLTRECSTQIGSKTTTRLSTSLR